MAVRTYTYVSHSCNRTIAKWLSNNRKVADCINIYEFRRQINCHNIHLIYGNHDTHIRKNTPLQLNSPYGPQEYFSSCQDALELHSEGHIFMLSHYSHRVWKGSHRGFIHLYGHSHGTLEDRPLGKSMDVGIDNAFKLLGEYRPFSIIEIINIMDKREIVFNDGHTKNTNV